MTLSDSLRDKISAYTPSEDAVDVLVHTNVVLLVGISGAGKDTIKHQLLLQYPQYYHHIVSHTTRVPRENKGVMEVQEIDYHFIDVATAEHMLDSQAFIEAKEYSSNLYGTSVAEFTQAHNEKKVAITDVEVQGVAEYVRLAPTVRPIFILPPSYETWQQRMMQRYGNPPLEGGMDNVQKRIATAKIELMHARDTHYFHFVINDDLATCTAHIHQLATASSFVPELSPDAQKVIDDILSRL